MSTNPVAYDDATPVPVVADRPVPSGAQKKLCWCRLDIEQRFGMRGGRFTRVNNLFACVVAVLLTAAAYAAMLPFRDRYAVQMFTERGAVQYVTVFFSFWAAVILAIKWSKTRLQERALHYELIPAQADFVLSTASASPVLERLHAVCDDPRRFILFNRIEMALANLRNMGRISDLDDRCDRRRAATRT